MALENRRIKMLLSVEISVLVQTLLVMCLGNNGQKDVGFVASQHGELNADDELPRITQNQAV